MSIEEHLRRHAASRDDQPKPLADSGDRTDFGTGALSDMAPGKGRCDLMPFRTLTTILSQDLEYKERYAYDFLSEHLCVMDNLRRDKPAYYRELCRLYLDALDHIGLTYADSLLELAKHYEDGAKKYAERNWEKGIPLHVHVDSATRHLLKYYRGDDDEPHFRAYLWRLVAIIWTLENRPDLNDFTVKEEAT